MLKNMLLLIGIAINLNACTKALSPQDTRPSQEAQCAALRHSILQAPITSGDNNTPTAIADNQKVNTQQNYHDECE